MEGILLNFIKPKKASERTDPNYYIYKEFILKLIKETLYSLEEKQKILISKGYDIKNRENIRIINSLNEEVMLIINQYDKSCSLEQQLKYEHIISSIHFQIQKIH